jgi:hypothetical protein
VVVKQLAVHQDDSNASLDHLVLQLVNIFLVTQNKKTENQSRITNVAWAGIEPDGI